MSFPPALAWLEESAKSWTHSDQQVYARAILDELKRLNDAVELQASELRRVEELRKKERHEYLNQGEVLQKTKEELEREQLAAEATQTNLERRLTNSEEKLSIAENLLRDIHHGLLKQPELTREDLAAVITSVVTPYPEGAKA